MANHFPGAFQHRGRIIPTNLFPWHNVSKGYHFQALVKPAVGITRVVTKEEGGWTHDVFFGPDLQRVTFSIPHGQRILEVEGGTFSQFSDDGSFADVSGSK